ncbi:phosphotransferase enzyme family protein [Sphingomonas faeni]|uniref:phosphotransferase enzyme family protein n=1 Tax=Sphingomonas faeni TaxID=185950 RepID=UPI00335C1BA3
MGLTMEAPTWPAITDDEAAAVLAEFPAIARIERLRWHSPRPFSAATLIDTASGTVLLKRHDRRVRSVAGLSEEHDFIAHLAAAGAPVPEVMLTADGASVVATGEWTYELHRQGAGDDLYRDRLSWTPFRSSGHAHAAGIALAQLHRASYGYDRPARVAQPLVASFSILPAADPLAATEAYVRAHPALGSFLAGRAWRPELQSLFAALGDGLAAMLADQPPLWTHNDWHPSNLLWSRDGLVATVFDFGLADRTCAVHDLATAIERSTIAWLRLGQGADDMIADPKAVRSLIAGYTSVLPLAPAALETVVRLVPLVHLEFALSEVAYFAGVLGDFDAASLAWDQYLLGHADWFMSAPGQDFLARIGTAGNA